MRDALDSSELAGVTRLGESGFSRSGAVPRESESLMSSTDAAGVSDRVRALAAFLSEGDAVRLRIQRGEEEIELTAPRRTARRGSADGLTSEAAPLRIDTINADLVGIFHFGRPLRRRAICWTAIENWAISKHWEFRTPIHALGSGRLLVVAADDEAPVEYGQALFLIARG